MLRGEVWLINLDPTIGAEIKKTRPAIIVNDNNVGVLPLRVVVPLNDWKIRYNIAPWMARIDPDERNNLTKISAADTFQIRSVSEDRFVRHVGTISDEDMTSVEQALAVVLRLKQ